MHLLSKRDTSGSHVHPILRGRCALSNNRQHYALPGGRPSKSILVRNTYRRARCVGQQPRAIFLHRAFNFIARTSMAKEIKRRRRRQRIPAAQTLAMTHPTGTDHLEPVTCDRAKCRPTSSGVKIQLPAQCVRILRRVRLCAIRNWANIPVRL